MTERKHDPAELFTTGNLVRIGILTALSAVLFLTIEIPIVPPMYKLDFSNVPVMLGAFSMGPLAGVLILVLKNLIQLVLNGLGSTMGIGNLADCLVGLCFLLPASLFYQSRKTRKRALGGMALGTACQVVAAVLMNYFIMVPFYMNAFHMDINTIVGFATRIFPFVDTELKFYLLACAPFNLLKGVLICFITYLIYKPLSPILHERG